MSGLGEHVFDKVARPADGYQTPLSLSSVRPRAGGGIGRRARLRALWAVWPVEVRVLFGALEKPVFIGLFVVSGSPAGDADGTRDDERVASGPGRASGAACERRLHCAQNQVGDSDQ